MSNLTSVGVTNGAPTSGTGTVSTLDNLIATGAPITNGSGTTVAVKAASTAPSASDPALVVAISPNSVNSNGRNTPANSAPVVFASQSYQTVAASSSNTVLGTTGATGDYLDALLINPATTTPGNVTLIDSSTTIATFAFGTLTDTGPRYVKVGAISKNGAWKITTGTNVSVNAIGNFT